MVGKSLTILVSVEAPRALEELTRRAAALCGVSVGQLARHLGVELPDDPRRAKGATGELVEAALGASAGNLDLPDFPELGVELKTIPLDAEGRVRESTHVCSIDLASTVDAEWENSRVWRKLRRVLWVPVESAAAGKPLSARRLGRALLWEPTSAQVATLEADWTLLVGRIAVGGVEQLDARMGEALQVRPKAANAAVQTDAPGADGASIRTGPRGFYLRARFTERVLWELTGS
ncbi:MAG: DNA mismatch repair endonuclease MutH [Proteobacteria bacterium]|nr:MAG: DNA mismatch repair endonuclease MutH [Pseudomonadota bacterium]